MIVLGWAVTIAATLYALWLAFAFIVAVPPPVYLLPRMALVCIAFTGGWYLRSKRPG